MRCTINGVPKSFLYSMATQILRILGVSNMVTYSEVPVVSKNTYNIQISINSSLFPHGTQILNWNLANLDQCL